MTRNKKIFDLTTILLTLILFFLIIAILGITFWKERTIESDFKFFSQQKLTKELNQITKGDRIIISFTGPVRIKNFNENILIEPQLEYESSWITNHQLQLIIKEQLIPEVDYKLKLKSFKGKWGFLNEGAEMAFSTDLLPVIEKITPVEGQGEIENKTEITFEFEEPIASQYYLKIQTDPVFEFKNIETTEKNKIIIKSINNLL
jgi:uncharacterized protein YxeA